MPEDNDGDKEKAEAYRAYFSEKLLAHQQKLAETYFKDCEKIDRRIDIEVERFLNMLRPPGTGRN